MNNLELREKVAEFLYNREFRGVTWAECSDIRRSYYLSFADELIALIGKCATPTFSGGNGYDNNGNPIQYGVSNESVPTEQKEYCDCPNRQVMYSGTLTQEQIDKMPCIFCNKPQPIPAEKKENLDGLDYLRKAVIDDKAQGFCECKEPQKTERNGYARGNCLICSKPIPKEKKKSFPISKCCNAFVVTIKDEIDKPLYMCQACNHPCDLAEKKDYDCMICIYHNECNSRCDNTGHCASYKPEP